MTKHLCNPRKKTWKFIVLVTLTVVGSLELFAQSDTIQTTVPHLKNVYAHDFYIGCLLSYRNIGFSTDPYVPGQSAVITPNGGYLIQYHMNSMSPGNNMKPQYTVNITGSASAYSAAPTQARKDSINIHPTIQFNGDLIAQLNWAQRQGFTFRGHTLVWHNQTPTTFFRTGYSSTAPYVSKDTMALRMDSYIGEVIRLLHQGWPGLLSAMDVVNEAIDDGTGKVRTTSNDWYATFHDSSYVMLAFQLARQYTVQYSETQMKLYYNDYNTDVSSKANGIVALLTPIYQAGYLDGIGMQEHNSLTNPTAQAFITSYNKFAPICSEMAVTELDVSTNSGTNNPSAAILAQQANQYGQLFKCFVERSYKSGRGKIISVSKDGLNDQYTFVTNQSTSLWNTLNQCKPAFFAAVDVGVYYNELDSLTTYAAGLQQNTYTPSSWTRLASALTSANSVKSQNYSVSVSADTALAVAVDSLQAALNGLVLTGVTGTEEVPRAFVLSQNYPNPFNPATQIQYSVPHASYVALKVFNVLGEEVTTLFAGTRQPGVYHETFDGSGLASGVYFYRFQAGGQVLTKKLTLLR
jgi:endo-1,4-beta-xylanase